MTEITFEVSTLTDVIAKAATIAPSKAGNAFDKAAGIMLDITPDDDVKCVVRATNLDVFYFEVIDVIAASGPATRWRLPSSVLADILKNIKGAPGRTVTLSHAPGGTNRVTLQSGRLRATIGMIDPDMYPEAYIVQPRSFSPTRGIGNRIEMVSWASAKAGSEPLSGVHFNGEYVIATDRYRIARVALTMDLEKPVTVPAGILSTLLKRAGEIEVGSTDTQMVFRPDDYTQITCSIFAMEYPDLSQIFNRSFDQNFKVNKQEFVDLVNSATAAATGDRSPLLRLIIGRGEVAVMLEGNDAMLGNVMELPGQCDHGRVSLYFTPQYLTDAVGRAPTETVTISYVIDKELVTRVPVRVDGGSEYQAWIAPRSANTPS